MQDKLLNMYPNLGLFALSIIFAQQGSMLIKKILKRSWHVLMLHEAARASTLGSNTSIMETTMDAPEAQLYPQTKLHPWVPENLFENIRWKF